jgi:hypothetical protein
VLFADRQPSAFLVAAAVAAGLVLLVILGALTLALFRGFEGFARKALERTYHGLDIRTVPLPGDVCVVYHTYHGLVAWHTETKHCVFLPPDAARELLGRLLRFNLIWGLTVHGGILVPPLAISNYIAQRRSITNQEREAASDPGSAISTTAATSALANSRRPSLIRRLFAWIMLVLSGLFGVAAIFALATRRFDAFFGGVVLALLLAWIARDWLSTRRRAPE